MQLPYIDEKVATLSCEVIKSNRVFRQLVKITCLRLFFVENKDMTKSKTE